MVKGFEMRIATTLYVCYFIHLSELFFHISSRFCANGIIIKIEDDDVKEAVNSNPVREARGGSSDRRMVWDLSGETICGNDDLQDSTGVTDCYLDDEEEEYDEEDNEEDHSSYQNSKVLDLYKPDPSLCKFVKVNIEGIVSQVYIFEPGTVVNVILCDKKEVWKPASVVSRNTESGLTYASDGKCLYCIAFFKNNQPELVLIHSEDASGLCKTLYEFKENMWTIHHKNAITRIGNLKPGLGSPREFSLDIYGGNEGGKCDVVRSNENGVTTAYYSARSGYAINSVVDGALVIWTANDGSTCYLCELYSKGSSTLLRLHIKEKDTISFTCYAKSNGTWKDIATERFSKTIGKMKECLHRTEKVNSIDLATPEGANLYKYTFNGITHSNYTIFEKLSISNVLDSGDLVWEAKKKNKKLVGLWIFDLPGTATLCRVDTLLNGVIRSLHFEKHTSWKKVNFKVYLERLKDMLKKGGDGIMVDCKALTRNMCTFYTYVEGGIFNTLIFPSEFKIRSLFYEKPVWNATNSEECLSAHVYTDKEKHFVKLVIKPGPYVGISPESTGNQTNNELYFEYDCDMFKSVPFKEFESALLKVSEAAKKNKPFNQLREATLDISNAMADDYTTYKYKFWGINKSRSIPLPNLRIVKVIDGEDVLWKSENDHERCLLSELFSKEESKILFINVKHRSHIGILYFERVDGLWKTLTKEQFSTKYNKMKCPSSPTTSRSNKRSAATRNS